MSMRTVVSLTLAGILLFGCFSADATAEEEQSTLRLVDGGPPRYAHRFESDPSEWGLESESVKLKTTPFNQVWEVSTFAPGTEPTPQQKRAADDLVKRCFESAQRHDWFDYETGLRDGYRILPGDGHHYRKNELLFDDAILDPDRPEVLMYYLTPDGYKLAGYMFHTSSRFERGPQIGGPLTLWHYHVWKRRRCVDDAGNSSGFIVAGEECDQGFVAYQRSYEMLHVWLIDRPNGPFSSGMTISQDELSAGLAKRKAERGF